MRLDTYEERVTLLKAVAAAMGLNFFDVATDTVREAVQMTIKKQLMEGGQGE